MLTIAVITMGAAIVATLTACGEPYPEPSITRGVSSSPSVGDGDRRIPTTIGPDGAGNPFSQGTARADEYAFGNNLMVDSNAVGEGPAYGSIGDVQDWCQSNLAEKGQVTDASMQGCISAHPSYVPRKWDGWWDPEGAAEWDASHGDCRPRDYEACGG